MARAGLDAAPPVTPPGALRPFLSFRRLPGRALEPAARALDDDGFRARVRDAVDAPEVGEAGWLLLQRPAGWRERLDALVAEAARQAEEAGAVGEAARLARELERTAAERDEAVDRARTEADAAAAARRALDVERDARHGAEQAVAELREQLAAARDERAGAVRDLKAVEARAVARLAELRDAQGALDHARAEVARLEGEVAAAAAGADTAGAVRGPGAPSGPGPSSSSSGGPGVASPTGAPLDREALAGLVERAAAAASSLSDALAEAAALVTPTAPSERPGGAPPADPVAASVPGEVAAAPGRRRPVPLPIGVFDDSPEAARHLLRHPGTTLAVDGYNVSLAGWPALPLADQRRRLVDALGALAARTGCSVVVVFDGADAGDGLPGESRPRGVQVRFTRPGVEADDELLALLEALPARRPVTVASSDRRVVDGARRRGATTVSAPQLLALLDR